MSALREAYDLHKKPCRASAWARLSRGEWKSLWLWRLIFSDTINSVCSEKFPNGSDNLIEKQRRELAEIEKALNESGTASGDERGGYSAADRIRNLTKSRDYFLRECDKARKANSS